MQEALTNALRHARAARVRVTVARDGDTLDVRVADDGVGLPADPEADGGHGVVGMRERATLLRGELSLGTGPDGAGTVVRASLPLTEAR